MASKVRGEREIELNGVKYKLSLNIGVITEFKDLTGKDFMQCATRAVNAWSESSVIDRKLAKAECLTSAVELDDAAYLIWLAAKEANSQVEFAEIQEGLLDEWDITREDRLYPAIFADLCLFAVTGDNYKKKAMDLKAG